MKKPLLVLCVLCACNDDPTVAQVDNGYDETDGVVVYKAWWSSTLFSDPVSPGSSSEQQRTVTNTDYAYAIISKGWDPKSSVLPTSLIAIRSSTPLTVARGDALHVVVSPGTFLGDCHHASVLSQEEADLITQRIFPGDFAGFRYDAASCTLTPRSLDGGAD